MQQGGLVAVTFSGQGSPHEPQTWNADYDWGSVTDSGAARLRRLAAHCGLTVADTTVGPVAHGLLPRRFVRVLAANLRLYEVSDGPATNAQLAVFWSLATRDAAAGSETLSADQAWSLALAAGA
jgi:hypothetical protein